ncbi:hypothetical protein TIFTF001_013978 [Ficus carica]|uniref:Uncharacterized protein n=1 Tax=Ficus carica TaxID=3494 RepID=A0AA88AQN5_FICCA|nr:hypothetical protein TIFTF001_013978 [Ficus carica]
MVVGGRGGGIIIGMGAGGLGVVAGVVVVGFLVGIGVGSGARARRGDNAIKGLVEALVFVFFVPCFAHLIARLWAVPSQNDTGFIVVFFFLSFFVDGVVAGVDDRTDIRIGRNPRAGSTNRDLRCKVVEFERDRTRKDLEVLCGFRFANQIR